MSDKDAARGTYQVGVVVTDTPDFGGALCTVKQWPGTAEGKTPPKDWAEACEYAVKIAEHMTSMGRVCEIRITTFEQDGPDDHRAEGDDSEDEMDEDGRCMECGLPGLHRTHSDE